MKRYQTDTLVRIMMNTRLNSPLDEIIAKILKRPEKVLRLINEGEGGKDLVETKRSPRVELKFDYHKNWENIKSKRSYVMNLIRRLRFDLERIQIRES